MQFGGSHVFENGVATVRRCEGSLHDVEAELIPSVQRAFSPGAAPASGRAGASLRIRRIPSRRSPLERRLDRTEGDDRIPCPFESLDFRTALCRGIVEKHLAHSTVEFDL
jgi:hypothetical protein